MDKKKAPDREQIKISIFPTRETTFRAGDLVVHNDLGIGLIIGFSPITDNPDIYFYNEQKIICVHISSINKA